jgi:hypothetical protein
MPSISDFKSRMTGGGARANQFQVELSFPAYVTSGPAAAETGRFLVKSASLPASQVENVQQFYRGRQVNFAGERTFQPWSITVVTDVDFLIRNAFEEWQAGLANYSTTEGITNAGDYQVDMLVHQLDRNGDILKTYRFYDVYPTNIGEIQVSYDNNNQIEEFPVELTYNYFTSDTGATL